jgi:hypothetical protein
LRAGVAVAAGRHARACPTETYDARTAHSRIDSKRCCGFHIAHKRVVHESVQPPDEVAPYGPEPDTVESWIDLEAVPHLAV